MLAALVRTHKSTMYIEILPFPNFKTFFRVKYFLFYFSDKVDCGLGNTAESCGSCAQCGNDPNTDCKILQGQPPQCIETGNCRKAKLLQESKSISIDSLINNTLIDLICFVADTSTIYRNCYLWLRYNENTTDFQGYNPSLIEQKIVKYSCNDTAKDKTCAFEGKKPGQQGQKRRRRAAGGGGGIKPQKLTICPGTNNDNLKK